MYLVLGLLRNDNKDIKYVNIFLKIPLLIGFHFH